MAYPFQIPTVVVVTKHFTDSFMKEDLRLLRQFAQVVPFEMGIWKPEKSGRFWRWLRQLRNLLKLLYYFLRLDVDVVVFWFAYVETPLLAAMSKLLRRKVILITGGGDSVYVPEIDWGDLKLPKLQKAFGVLLNFTDAVLPFSNSAKEWIAQRFHPKYIRTIYPSIDTNFFMPAPERIQRRVVTCCYSYGAQEIIQKGLDTFVQTARRLPAVEFVVIGNALGVDGQTFQRQAPANVTFLPRIPSRAGYRDFLQSCSVYAQLSVHEGFGVSLAEAMACGCLPVVTNRYSLPEVVGDCGWVIPYGRESVDAAMHAIEQAFGAEVGLREKARNRIVTLFSKHIRGQQLHEELVHLLPNFRITRVELGCGSTGVPGAIGVDMRLTSQTQAVCDVRHSCFMAECADEVYSFCVLEHLDNPYELMDEVIRILKPNGTAFLRVPNINTFSAHLDLTHRFLADLSIWKSIMLGYFEEVEVVPVGTKYRDNRLLVAINRLLVKIFKFNELTQGWTFVCTKKRANPTYGYIGWWQESALTGNKEIG